MPELKPCPFCGKDAQIAPDEIGSGGQHVPPYHAGCLRGAGCGIAFTADDPDEAIAEWNRRALSTVTPAEVGGLVAEWREAAKHVTPGPWRVYDGCSWRRIGTAHGKHDDCAVVYPYSAPDGHPDLGSSRGNDTQENLAWLARCSPDRIDALLTALEAQAAELADVRADALKVGDQMLAEKFRADNLAAQLVEARKALEVSASALDEAREDVEHWGSYAGEYFQNKHDLEGDLGRIAKQASAARRALTGGQEDG